MPKQKLNAQSVKALQPTEKRLQIFDTEERGLCLRVTPAGVKSWSVVYKKAGRMQRYTLGLYPAISLADARQRAHDAVHDVAHGEDPQAEKKEQRLAGTFGDLVETYLEKYAARKRSAREDKRILNKYFVPELRYDPVKEVTRVQIRSIIEDVAARAPIMGNRALACVRKVFNWAISQDVVKSSPCFQLSAPSQERRRDRVLSDEELFKIWKAFEAETSSVADAFKLRLLTAQRGGEVLGMQWKELNLQERFWTIPAERSKNKLPHRVWLSDPVFAILDGIQKMNDKRTKRQGGPSPWVFPGKRKGASLVETKSVMKTIRAAAGVDDWKGHDLRRTAASKMGEIGVPRFIIGRILNHAEPGVTAVYDRHSYDSEKKDALERWAKRLMVVTSGLKVVGK